MSQGYDTLIRSLVEIRVDFHVLSRTIIYVVDKSVFPLLNSSSCPVVCNKLKKNEK